MPGAEIVERAVGVVPAFVEPAGTIGPESPLAFARIAEMIFSETLASLRAIRSLAPNEYAPGCCWITLMIKSSVMPDFTSLITPSLFIGSWASSAKPMEKIERKMRYLYRSKSKDSSFTSDYSPANYGFRPRLFKE